MSLGIWRLNLKNSITYGTRRGKVHVVTVIAECEFDARQLAAGSVMGCHGEEDFRDEYIDPNLTDCVMLGIALPEANPMVVTVDHDYDYNTTIYEWAENERSAKGIS